MRKIFALIVSVFTLSIVTVQAQNTPTVRFGADTDVCTAAPEENTIEIVVDDQTSTMQWGFNADAGATLTIAAPGVNRISIIDFTNSNMFGPSVADVNGDVLTHTFETDLRFAFWVDYSGRKGHVYTLTLNCGEAALQPTGTEPTETALQPAIELAGMKHVEASYGTLVVPDAWTVDGPAGAPIGDIVTFVDGNTTTSVIIYPRPEGDKSFLVQNLENDAVTFAGIFQVALGQTMRVEETLSLSANREDGIYQRGTVAGLTAAVAVRRFSDTHAIVIISAGDHAGVADDVLAAARASTLNGFSSLLSGSASSQPRAVYVTTDDQIATIAIDGTDIQVLTTESLEYFGPRWSPDSSKIAYRATVNDDDFYFVMNADGSDVLQIAECGDYFCSRPVWSPDGKSIAYTQTDSMTAVSVEIIDTETLDRRSIAPTFFGYSYVPPAWSPDGTTIAFTFVDGSVETLLLANVAAGTVRRTTHTDDSGIFYWTNMVWSPDSKEVFVGAYFERLYALSATSTTFRAETVSDKYDSIVEILSDGSRRFANQDTITTFSANGEELSTFTVDGIYPEIQPEIRTATSSTSTASSSTDTGTRSDIFYDCQIRVRQNTNTRSGPGTNYDIARVRTQGQHSYTTGYTTGSDGRKWWLLDDGAWVRDDTVRQRGNECSVVPQVAP